MRERFSFINRALVLFLMLLAAVLGLSYAVKQGIFAFNPFLAGLLQTVVVMIGTLLAATLILKFTQGRIISVFAENARYEHKLLLTKFYSGFIYLLAAAIILWQLGVTVTNITLIAGLLATGFAFAVRDVILSYFVWYILLTKRPFVVGDFIRIGEHSGIVKHIGTFFVHLDPTPQTTHDFKKLPNRIFLEQAVHNYGAGTFHESVSLPLQTCPADCAARIEQLTAACTRYSGTAMLKSTPSGISVEVSYSATYAQRRQVEHEILLEMIRLFNESYKRCS